MKKIIAATLIISSLFGLSAFSGARFEKLELFSRVLSLIETHYYRKVDTQKLINGAIRGMMRTLDPHSSFLDKEVFGRLSDDTRGEYGGLGLEVSVKDNAIIIVTAIDDTPASRAGLRSGDKIVEIDGEKTIGLTLDEGLKKMKGKVGESIQLGISRKDVAKILRYKVKRKIIKIRPVKSWALGNGYIFLRLGQFQRNSAQEMAKAYKEKLKAVGKKNLKGIILDFRSNPGGLLDEAVSLSSLFLKEGIVVSTEGRQQKDREVHYVQKKKNIDLETPLIVLINGASASASEIVAGALQDHKRAIVMGSRSFGKGSVQTVAKLGGGQGLKLTIAQYMTPKGRKIQALGIRPDIELDEFASRWIGSHKVSDPYIRESDLRNHLTATIESKEEKKIRLEKEKMDRLERIKGRKKSKRKNNIKGKDVVSFDGRYSPKKDPQVKQAINYMQVIQGLKK